ncbi:RICIN domain-containing protein [Fulvivirga ligni]|uniref:RICIN domain-containing protein n=1 Tax=Fulvivirga ligni TaxID=2904246 RepID=UPI001F1D6429|nr:RICIN domain-containing protein [Fulvivirga ligni]UII23737.1 RICIN domain-containing protein [Fulvivirga ligni]
MKNLNLKTLWRKLCITALALLLCSQLSWSQMSGNPILSGDHPDPEIRMFNGKYYIYPTATQGNTDFHAFSSNDLTNWVDEGAIFSVGRDCSWANVNGWAPSVISRNGKYYLYYTAETKIGCAISNSPTGPFVDIGYPFIGSDPYTVDIIDAMAFIDDDGQAYLYYGGSNGSRMVVRRLNPDMISFASGPMDITPPNYTEAPFLVKRDGIYYMTYSNGAWYNASYNVQYATSSSPTGPWTYRGSILSSSDQITGPGHHSIVQIPGCDDYYMVYHRYDNGNYGFRSCNIDKMYFDPDGSIRKVDMTNSGVQARAPYGGECSTGNVFSGATYKLIHKGTNQCLDVDSNSPSPNANVHQWTSNTTTAQQWVITLQADGHYKLKHKGTDQCLDVVNNSATPGTNVIQYTDNGNDAQRWMLRAMADGYYKLVHKNTSQCLDVSGNSSSDGANVQQWNDNGNNAQRWKLQIVSSAEIISGAIYELEPQCAPGKRLDVASGSNTNGANVQIYERNNNIAQAWQIVGVGNGLYEIIPQCATGRRLDVAGGQDQAGSNMHIWESYSNTAQRFRFIDQGNGYYEIEPECAPGKRLDVANISQDNNTNVLMWNDLNNAAQRWKLILKSQNAIAAKTASAENIDMNDAAQRPYPNPFKNEIHFPVASSTSKDILLIITDISGKVIVNKTITRNQEASHVLWNGKNDSGQSVVEGMYFYKVISEESIITGSILKQ